MQQDINNIIKNAFVEYVKSHNEYEGTIMEIADHMVEANKAIHKLPINLQKEIWQLLSILLAKNGNMSMPPRF